MINYSKNSLFALQEDEKQKEKKLETKEHSALEVKQYELSAVVCYVNDQNAPDKKNLVALIKVPESYLKNRDCGDHKWYLFNDFRCVTTCSR